MMKSLTVLVFTLLVAPAFAGMTTLSTPALQVSTDRLTLCNVSNASTKTFDVTVTIVGSTGNTIGSNTFSALAPGSTVELEEANVADFVRCVFSFSGSSKLVRTDIEVIDSTGLTPLVTLPAS